jgi:thiol:disulfide interchange protein
VARVGGTEVLGAVMSEAPRFKVIGIVVGLAVLALGAGFFLLTRGQSSSSAASTHTVIPLSQRTNGKRAKTKAHPVKHRAVKPVRKPTTKPASKPAAQQNGLPSALDAALSRSRVVVVSLYAPRVELDDTARLEAQAGAAAAGAGFVAVNVLDEAQARPLTKQLGVLDDPSVLVFRRPDELVIRLTGFADKETVEQAARNAGL